MRLNRLTKLAQLMNEAKEQYFNLYNDMKDSIYVEQKGRTVGDVEVLPGKTLSGCITSSNINIYYTNLMGGKDSKVIRSSELIALIPSLTTKKGELSPTLNISKVLINTSIQKYNSANKLAELKKIAEVYDLSIRPGDAEPVDFPPINPPESRDSYIQRANNHLGHDHTEELGAFYDKQVAKSGSNSGGSKPSPAKATAKISTEVIDDAHKGKTLTDNAGYTYVVAPDGKSLTFSIRGSQPKTLNQSYKNWKSVVGNINAIPVTSSSTATPAAKTQAPAATGAAATTQTAGEAAKTQQTERQFDANALAGVKAVLVRAATPGGFGLAVTTAANERARIQRMVSVIQKVIGQNIDAYDFLTKMLLVSPRGEQSLVPWFSKENYSNAIATAPRKDVVADKNGTGPFNRPVAAVLSVLNEIYSGEFADDNEGTIRKFRDTFVKGYATQNTGTQAAAPAQAPAVTPPATPPQNTPVTPPAAPAPAAEGKADDGYKKSSSRVDPRIRKLATLRRLRVRSQMEAATDSSAQFGRSRVS